MIILPLLSIDALAISFLSSSSICFSSFKETSLDVVMAKMTFGENVIVKKGYFPETTEGIEDTFCFVNLDMDLYLPMLAGLRFF